MASSSPLLISPSMAEDLDRVEAELRTSVQTDDPFLTEVASADRDELRELWQVAVAKLGHDEASRLWQEALSASDASET